MILLNAFEVFNLNQLLVDLSSNQFKCFGFHDANILANNYQIDEMFSRKNDAHSNSDWKE